MIATFQIFYIGLYYKFVIPAFNIPFLPMMKPVIEAIRDENSFALVQVARLEWEKFESKSLKAVRDEYECWRDEKHVRLHLDHVPALDDDAKLVDYMPIINEAIELGYDSLMIDASRLSLEENIEVTKRVCDVAHQAGLACEAELGAVLGHESGPLPPYDEIFASGESFTKVDEAAKFVAETGCDWLSVAIGNIHGAISESTRGQTKIAARLDIQHLKELKDITNIPLVLHGGSGIRNEYIIEAIKNGIAKINVGTEIRQAYEKGRETGDIEAGRKAVYLKTREIIKEHYMISGTADIISTAGKE